MPRPLRFGAVLTLFVSAFLLFSCEPMVAKMILPVLGGSASVWSTCVLFFQIMLLAGYGYAHVVSKVGRLRDQYLLHSALMLLAIAFLPIRFGAVSDDPSRAPIAWLLQHLLLSVGLPFAVISATAPLLQAWLARTRLAWAENPYFLYAVSNTGSLLALAAYPILFDREFGVREQSRLWLYGYGLLVLCFASCMRSLWKLSRAADRATAATEDKTHNTLSWKDRLQWIAAAFVPSALTLAVTNHISLNIGSFPFLWVAPLALYLLTFAIAFSRQIRIPLALTSSAATAILVVLFPIVTVNAPVRSSELWPLVGAHLLILFVAALLCHSFLAGRRPVATHLTSFYFMLALGGVLGGAFTAVVAPVLFNSIFEYPLLIAVVILFRQPRRGHVPFRTGDAFDLLLFGMFTAFVLVAVLSWGQVDVTRYPTSTPVVAGQTALILVLFLFRNKNPLQFGIAFSGLVLTYAIVLPREFEGASRVHSARNFFGVKKVLYESDINMRKLLHGDTLHGRQSLDEALAAEPLSYYHRTGPVGDVMRLIEKRPSQHVGVVGLGTGTIAAYGAAERRISFFDIDPQMVDIATGFFTYLRGCGEHCDVLIGDGRLSLQKQNDGEFDVVILDAFNSDSIPAHLVSRDAVRMYMAKLKPDGLLMFHVSNRYLDVEKLVSSVLTAEEITAFVRHDTDETPPGKSGSHYVLALKRPEALDEIPHHDEWRPVEANTGIRPWTDDFSDLVSIVK